MSGLDRWLAEAKNVWETWRLQFARLTPGSNGISDQLHAADALNRWRGVRALIERPNPGLLPELLQLCGDEDELVRGAAVDALVSWGPGMVLEPARQALSAQPGRESAVSLLILLARLPDAANRAAIEPWLQADEPEMRAAAFMALAALCDDADLPRLQAALAEDDILVQRAIMAALCAPEAGSLAEEATAASDPILRQRAAQARPRIQRQLEAKRKAEARTQKSQQTSAEDKTENDETPVAESH